MSGIDGLQFKKVFQASSLDTTKPAANALKSVCDSAYDLHGTSCSHAVNAAIRDLHGWNDAQWPQRQANLLVDFLSANWTAVTLERAYELAQNGVVVVGGKKDKPNGHVIVVYPGAKKPRGGYTYTRNGEQRTVRAAGSYPRALSTSIGSWPGAKSKGDKTVWDPWGNDAAFGAVRFWARKEDATARVNVSRLITSRIA